MDFQEYQNNFDKIVNKAQLLDLHNIYEQETGWKLKRHQGPCPFCNSGHGSHIGSDGAFSIRTSTNMATCFSCGTKTGVVKLIMHHNRLTYKEAIHYIAKNYFHEELVNPSEEIIVKVHKRKVSKWTKPSDEEVKKEELKKKRTFAFLFKKAQENTNKELAKNYLTFRGIKPEKLGNDFYYQHDAYKNLPGGIVFFDSEKKLLNKRYVSNDLPEGVKKSFNYGEKEGQLRNSVYDKTFIPTKRQIFVTEGVINALSFYNINESAIAVFSTSNIIDDVEKFTKFFKNKEVIIAFDFDKAGQKGAIKLADFIIKNFNTIILKILLFPTIIDKNKEEKSLDVNDLLQNKTLELHLRNSYNYILPTTDFLKTELDKIISDYKFYFPNAEYKNYSYEKKGEKEKNNTHKFIPVNKKNIVKELAAELKYDVKTLKKTNIRFLESYYFIKGGIKHTFNASQGNPILLLNSDNASIIWRPKAKSPFQEYEYFINPSFGIIGKSKLINEIGERRAELDAQILETSDKTERKKLERKKPVQSLFITFNMLDYLKIREIDKEAILLLNDKLDYNYYTEDLKPNIYNIYLLPNNTAEQRLKARAIGLVFIEFLIFKLDLKFKSIAEYLTHLEGREHVFFKKLNTALPFKFWEYEGFEVKLNLIAFLNFVQTKGFFSYEDQKDKKGYQYIKIENRIVKSYDDKELFVRFIRSYANNWLHDRGEHLKIRNKILTSGEFTERNLSQLKQIELDFENSGKNFQNFFFKDGHMWIISNGEIKKYEQTKVKKHIWEHDLIDLPSKIKSAPFKISYRKEYKLLLDKLKNTKKGTPEYKEIKNTIKKISETKKYDIEILNRDNYFLQFLWLTSYLYWKDAENEGYEIQKNDFWFELEKSKIIDIDKIDEMKLHLINKITALGYLTKDYRGPKDDYGIAILDAIDLKNDGLKREAAGGGKSIIAKALTQIKRIYEAEDSASEDFCKNKHRYENYDKEKLLLIDDMHKNARLGDILTDFSNGITVNPKHKKPIPIPLTRSPKIIVTRNYIDMEGARVDRRIFRMFVCDFFHKKNGGKYREEITPDKTFGFSFFSEETEEQKSDLVNFFAYSYLANQEFGEIDSPIEELMYYRIIKQIGEPLIEFLDIFLENIEDNYIDLLWLFSSFKIEFKETFNSFQRTKLYNTTSNFKKLLKLYCEINDLVFNPDDVLNQPKEKPIRIVQRSDKREGKTAEHIFIATQEQWEKLNNQEQDANQEKQNPEIKFTDTEDDLPF